MPVYTYQCQTCRIKFKQTQPMFEKPVVDCPECHLGVVQRVPQLPAWVFKGSAWDAFERRGTPGLGNSETRLAVGQKIEN